MSRLSRLSRLLVALAAAAAVASASQCTCPDPTPCQHLGGTVCYAMTANSNWNAIDSGEGHASCPKETRHCACDCSGQTPCRKVDQQGDVTCVGTIEMYGKQVCPLGAAHCQHASQQAASTSSQDAAHIPIVPMLPTPDQADTVCKCAGDRPCLHSATGICTMLHPSGGCPADTIACRCGCGMGSHPCQHHSVDQCFPAEFEGANKMCPASTTMCEQASHNADGSVPDELCRCGGLMPCQDNHDSTGTQCHAMVANAEGVLGCSVEGVSVTKCDCHCSAEQPCRYVDPATSESYCFGAEPDGTCPEKTKKCNAPKPATSFGVENVAPTPAPPTTNSVHYDKTAEEVEATTTSSNEPSAGATDCAYNGWTEWSPCTRKCGGGTKMRSARVTRFPTQGGAACPKNQVVNCNTAECDNVNCVISGWSAWMPCSQDCGGGLQYKNPIVDTQAKDYGGACPAPMARPCNTQSCFVSHAKCECDPLVGDAVPLHAQVAPAKGDLACTHNNGVTRVFHPACEGDPDCVDNGYHNCQFSNAKGCKCCKCNALTCEASLWGDWSACDAAEYDGQTILTRTRTRQVKGKMVQGDGVVCPHVTQREVCESAALDSVKK